MTEEAFPPPNGNMATTRGSRPVPDPTELTDRALARLERTLILYVDGKFEVVDERLRGIDTATGLRLSQVTRTHDSILEDIDRAVGSRASVVEERFRAIEGQFKERDTRSERESRDNKVAVDAAFAAQKEAAAKQDEANAKAIDKSERATAETIKTNQELSRQAIENLTKDVDSLKIAVSRIDSTKVGNTESRTAVYAAIGIGITIVLFIITLIGLFAVRANPA